MSPTRRRFIGTWLAASGGVQTLAAAPSAPSAPSTQLATPGTPSPALGSKLALMDLPLIEGGKFLTSEASGKVVVVYWWASWCPFCAEMSPHIEKLWRSQRERGLTVLGISIDTSIDAPRDYRRRKGYTFPSTMYAPEIESTIHKPKGIPVLWVRDKAGKVVMAEQGQLFPEDVEQIARFL